MAQPQGPQQGGNRPGAMTMAMQAVKVAPTGPKVLRIGLIQNGKIVEERVIRTRETVSVGTSERNHFIIHAQGLPSRFDLFQLVGQDYILNFTEQMTGRVGLSGGVSQLDQLRTSGAARNAGGYWQVKLNDQSRGRIVVGDATLLFQFVVLPPIAPKPQLPLAVQGGFVKSIDWPFTAFVVASFMFFFGAFIALETYDPPYEDASLLAASDLAAYIFDEPAPPPEPVEDETPTDAPTTETAATETPTTRPREASNTPARDPGESAPSQTSEERSAAIRDQAAQQAQQLLLSAFGGESGAFSDVLRGGAVTANSADVMQNASGVGVASNTGSGTIRARAGGEGSGQGGDLGNLRGTAGAGQAANEGTVTERTISGNVNVGGGGDIGGAGEFDSSTVNAAMRRASAAIRRCYENELRNSPSLSGKVTVQFTIQESGTVSGASASENTTGSGALASCVTGAVGRLRFNPGPVGGSVQYRYPFVFSPQN